jgi:hypothetical protein
MEAHARIEEEAAKLGALRKRLSWLKEKRQEQEDEEGRGD